MKTIQTEILIDAEVSKVWDILMDFETYPKWNPFIKSISGEQKIGEKLTVSIKPPGGNGMTFKPKILAIHPPKEFRWKGQLGIPGIFDGEHFFLLEASQAGKTQLIHGENFSGILTSLFGKTLEKTQEGFELMNKALKQECEK